MRHHASALQQHFKAWAELGVSWLILPLCQLHGLGKFSDLSPQLDFPLSTSKKRFWALVWSQGKGRVCGGVILEPLGKHQLLPVHLPSKVRSKDSNEESQALIPHKAISSQPSAVCHAEGLGQS